MADTVRCAFGQDQGGGTWDDQRSLPAQDSRPRSGGGCFVHVRDEDEAFAVRGGSTRVLPENGDDVGDVAGPLEDSDVERVEQPPRGRS